MKEAGLWILTAAVLCGVGPAGDGYAGGSESGELVLKVTDSASGEAVACRVHLKDANGAAVLTEQAPSYRDHFCCDGGITLRLAAGSYSYVIERGPEYRRCEGTCEVVGGGSAQVSEVLRRSIEMAGEGWWSGDMHVHRAMEEMDLLMRAEDLHVAPTITWWNRSNMWANSEIPEERVARFGANRFCDVLAGEDERNGGAFMYFNVERPVDITGAEAEYPCALSFIEKAKRQDGCRVDIEKPFWWDVPVALAYGYGDSIGLLNNHCWRSGMLDNEAWGRARDRQKYPSPAGNGWWSQEIYYHILNSGIRLAPSAGSASGVLDNPVGYNRVYVYTGGEELDYGQWWENLRRGACVVTNGPLLIPEVSGQRPGHVFRAEEGGKVELDVRLRVESNDALRSIEVVKNGVVERKIESPAVGGEVGIGAVTFSRSGWLLIRATADVGHTFRFASTAPYYVEVGDVNSHVSRRSVEFFSEWVDQRIEQIKIDDAAKLGEVLAYQERARRFWQRRLGLANSE